MNLILFVITLVVSFFVVWIGAIAFQLTGLKWPLAKFQALSCFSGTGFTTRESEMITTDAQRRRIASVLMIFGNAGLVTLIATFANSIRTDMFVTMITIPYLEWVFPSWLMPIINLVIVIAAVYLVYRIFSSSFFAKKVTILIRRYIIKKKYVKAVSFEELLVAAEGHSVAKVEIGEDSPVANRDLRHSGLREKGITVLVVEQDEKIIANPKAETVLHKGCFLTCYGKITNIRKLAG